MCGFLKAIDSRKTSDDDCYEDRTSNTWLVYYTVAQNLLARAWGFHISLQLFRNQKKEEEK